MLNVRNFKGTHDIYGKTYFLRQVIQDIIKTEFINYGFQPLDTPAIEYLDLLLSKYGANNEKLIFPLAYKGSSNAALRYDLTIPLARFIIQNKDHLTFPFRRYQIQKVWRADSPQFGRYREFYQCDADIISSKITLVEIAEIFFMIYSILYKLNLESFKIFINHRQFLELLMELFSYNSQNPSQFFQILDKQKKMKLEDFQKLFETQLNINYNLFFSIVNFLELYLNNILQSFYLSTNQNELDQNHHQFFLELESLYSNKIKMHNNFKEKLLALFKEFYDLIQILYYFSDSPIKWNQIKTSFQISISLARGMDYYSSWIYEASFTSKPLSILGGGIYNNLIASIKKENINQFEGIGLSFGLDRILNIVLEKLKSNDSFQFFKKYIPPIVVLILRFPDEDLAQTVNLLKQLRSHSIPSKIYENSNKNIKKQIQEALKQKIPFLCLLGKKEIENNEVKIRVLSYEENQNFNSKPKEYTVQKNFFIEKIKSLIQEY